jgi:polysaccharide pyruvyl transferase WcaK-like protein
MINVLGFYGKHNVGDESYKLSFPKIFPQRQFEFTSKIDNEPEQCILGGGNVISDHFLDQIYKLKCPKLSMSVSITKNDPIDRLNIFGKILVRDFASQELLKQHNIQSEYAPDFAFILEPQPIDLTPYFAGKDQYEKKVAVVLNSYLLSDGSWLAREFINFERVVLELASVFDTTPASFIFVPFSTGEPFDDRVSNAWLSSRCKFWKKNVVIYEPLDPQTTLNIISSVDAVISSRLHSSIFSCIAGKPFIDLTHHSKNLKFLESIYKKDWSVSYWHFDSSKFTSLLNGFLFDSKDYYTELETITKQHRKILERLNVRFF